MFLPKGAVWTGLGAAGWLGGSSLLAGRPP